MTYSSLNLSLLLPGKPVPIKPVGLPVSVRVGHFKARPDPEARSLEVALPVQGSWRVGLGSGSGFGSGLTSLLETDYLLFHVFLSALSNLQSQFSKHCMFCCCLLTCCIAVFSLILCICIICLIFLITSSCSK